MSVIEEKTAAIHRFADVLGARDNESRGFRQQVPSGRWFFLRRVGADERRGFMGAVPVDGNRDGGNRFGVGFLGMAAVPVVMPVPVFIRGGRAPLDREDVLEIVAMVSMLVYHHFISCHWPGPFEPRPCGASLGTGLLGEADRTLFETTPPQETPACWGVSFCLTGRAAPSPPCSHLSRRSQ